ncbi:hypothetical protein [Fictibacillus phosphorivorans]|nr:hypothetical protein [Fictibacillus phosphorivorans]
MEKVGTLLFFRENGVGERKVGGNGIFVRGHIVGDKEKTNINLK